MKKRNLLVLIAALSLGIPLFSSCSKTQGGYVDGYYTAEIAEFDSHGWKEFVTICVSGGKVVTMEYNAKNPSGMIKSWDMGYMRVMNTVAGTYPNKYTRTYAANILSNQNADNVDLVTGATHSYHTFEQLSKEVLDLARSGEEQIVFVVAEE